MNNAPDQIMPMTIEQLRNMHRATPFRPFTIHMADGRQLDVPHPDFLSHSPSGRTIIVHGEGDTFSVVDLLLVTELTVADGKSSSGKASKRRS